MKQNKPRKKQRFPSSDTRKPNTETESRNEENAPEEISFHFIRKRSHIAALSEALMKALVAGCAACGITLLICDSAQLNVSLSSIIFTTAFWIIALFLLCRSKRSAVCGILIIVIPFAAIILHLNSVGIKVNPFTYLAGGTVNIWNRMMIVIDSLGFVTLPQIGMNLHRSDYSSVFFFTLVSCLVYYLAVRKKTKLSITSIFTALICSPLFIYNMPNDNAGICLLLASTAGFAAMRICEKHTAGTSPSGHTGLAALLLSALLLIIPCYTVNQPWIKIDIISEKIEVLRQIVTDIAEGKPISITDMISSDDPTGKRNTTADKRTFRGIETLYVYSDSNAPLYLRNWIGGDFSDNAWTAPNTDYIDYDITSGYPSSPHTITEDFLAAYEEYREMSYPIGYWNEANAALREISELGITYTDILITPKKQTRLIAIPYMTISPITSPSGDFFSVDYKRINDGIYLADKKLKTTDPYTVKALIPFSRTDASRENLNRFIKEYYIALNLDSTGNAVSFSVRSPSDEVKERNKVYTELAYLLYGGAADSPAVDRIVEDIFLTTEIRQYYNPAAMYDSILPSGNRVATLIDESNNPISFYSDHEKLVIHADDIARIVIDYLGDHYRYSLTPPKPTSDDSMEEFLLISKEGYCVQFATAATLIMRQLGFSARYAEGYIANSFSKNNLSNGYAYQCRVKDKNAHAWMEIWISGFGWMQYEVTPGFTDGAYSAEYIYNTGSDDTEEDTDEKTDTTEEATNIKPPESSIPSDTTERIPGASKPPVTTSPGEIPTEENNGILLAVFIIIATASVSALWIFKRSSAKQKYRTKLFSLALSPDKCEKASIGSPLCMILFDTLRAFGLVPGSKELPSAFAARADSVLSGMHLHVKPSEAIYAAENQIYGNGMTKDDMHTVVSVVTELTAHAKSRLGIIKFLWYRHILCII